MRPEDMKKVLEIGVKLSSERDLERLLEEILTRKPTPSWSRPRGTMAM